MLIRHKLTLVLMSAQVQARQGAGDAELLSLARSELLWRDFFRFTAKKYASASLQEASPQQPQRSALARGGRAVQPAVMPSLALAVA